MSLPRLAVLVSGSGSNLQALLNAINAGELAADPVLVLSNKRAAYGLERARQADVPAVYFPYAPYKTHGRVAYDAALAAKVGEYAPDLIVLAGWMRILTPAFLDAFPRRVINLHPALQGAFDGTQAIERAFAAYQRGEIEGSGCMVHYAIPEVDAGPVIAQTAVPILPTDSLEDFAQRMHTAEHQLIVAAARLALEALAGS